MLKGLHYTYMHAYIQRNYTYKSINDYDQLVGSLRFLVLIQNIHSMSLCWIRN